MEKKHLYEIPLKAGQGCNLPSNFLGAYLNCYVPENDHLKALDKAVSQLKEDYYVFIDVTNDIREVDVKKWDQFVDLGWKEFKEHFPNSEELLEHCEDGTSFYGPIFGYDSESEEES